MDKDKKKLHILWTNADPDTSILMVMMYAKNSMLRKWWDQVTVIIWGATAKLVAENEMIRAQMDICRKAGVKFSACVSCASQLGVAEQLEDMGIEVIPWGAPLSELLQCGAPLLTV